AGGAAGAAGHGGQSGSVAVGGQGGGAGVAGQGGGAAAGGAAGTQCKPNTAVCTPGKTLQICNDKGLQQPPPTCDGACVKGACVGGAHGATPRAPHAAPA